MGLGAGDHAGESRGAGSPLGRNSGASSRSALGDLALGSFPRPACRAPLTFPVRKASGLTFPRHIGEHLGDLLASPILAQRQGMMQGNFYPL